MSKRLIQEAWSKIKDQLSLARRFLKEGRVDEALYFVWIAAENLVNTIKVSINGRYVKD
jgi:HEPN domain-containing protein